jgi:PEP-CTERM motif
MKKHASLLMLLGIGLLTVVSPALAGAPKTPEPSTILLIGGGLGAVILYARKKRSKQ